MNEVILDGGKGIWRVEGGEAYVYATRLEEGRPAGRLYLYEVAKDGETLREASLVRRGDIHWGCLVRMRQGVTLQAVTLEEGAGDNHAFAAFIDALAEQTAREQARIDAQSQQRVRVLENAHDRLREVNTKITSWIDDTYAHEDELVEACNVLGKYLGVDILLPAGRSADRADTLLKEILHLSGIRYKPVILAEEWWKKDSGALMGTLMDGTPITLLPRGMRGYRAFNPRTNETTRVTREVAETIAVQATAVYRTLPAEPVGFRRLMRFVLGEHIYVEIAIILLFSFLSSVAQVLPPILSKQIFDVIVPEYLRGMLVEIILILLAFAVANIGFSVLVNLGFARIKNKVELSLQAGIWDRLIMTRIPFFHRFTSGELLEKIKGIGKLKDALSLNLLQTFLAALFSFVNVIVMYRYSPEITRYVLLMFAACFVLTGFICRRIYLLNQRVTELSARATSLRQQLVDGIRRIKTSCAEERVYGVWSRYEAEERALRGRIQSYNNVLNAFYAFFRFASIAVLYLLIARQSEVGMGVFVAYISTFLIFQGAMMNLMGVLRLIPDLLPIAQSIKPIMQAVPEQSVGKTVPQTLDGSLMVEHVSFQYEAYGREVLKDVSLQIKPGESVGIVGFSGCGKTTLLDLLLGLYAPSAGRIYVGGYDLETLDLQALRRQMGVVLQRGALIVGDIYSNIVGEHSDITEAMVWDVLARVGLADTVRTLPHGLYTMLEAGEYRFSDGQMQQLLIAQAIVAGPRYVFFDEATSHLDNLTQAKVLSALDGLNTTKIIIAQRLPTVRNCDRIILLDRGRILGEGTYDEVVQRNMLLN